MVTSSPYKDQADSYVADPFIVIKDGTYYLFHEFYWIVDTVADSDIHYCTSPDGLNWTYQARVPIGANHWSYPYVFKCDGDYFMTPCPPGAGSGQFPVVMYRANPFPTKWEPYWVLHPGPYLYDPTPFKFGNYWYMLAGDKVNDCLRLFWNTHLYGNGYFTEHPSSPLYNGTDHYRPAGRPLIHDTHVDVWLQSDPTVKATLWRLSDLTPTTVTMTQRETPVLTGDGTGWNSTRMHHCDRINSGFAVVDGKNDTQWNIGIYRDTTP